MSSARQLTVLYLLTATLMIGYGAIFSLLAEIRDTFGFTPTHIGFIGASAFASGFIAQLFLSRFADIGHGSLMLKAGLAICIISTFWMIFADTLAGWLISRGLLGFGAGIVRPAIRRYIVIADPMAAGRALGVLTAYETAGFLIGPVVAAVLLASFGLASTFVLVTLLLVLFTPMIINIEITAAAIPPDRRIMLDLIRRPAMQSCLAMGTAFWITIGVFEAIWAVFLSDLGASQLFIGLTMSLFGLPMIFISPRAGDYAQHRGTLNVAVVSIGLAIVCMLFYGLLDSIWLLCIPLAVHAIADAFTMPATQLAVAQASGQNAVASGQGLFGAIGLATGALTASLGGWLYQDLGAAGLWWFSAAAMLFLLIGAWLRGDELKQPYVVLKAI